MTSRGPFPPQPFCDAAWPPSPGSTFLLPLMPALALGQLHDKVELTWLKTNLQKKNQNPQVPNSPHCCTPEPAYGRFEIVLLGTELPPWTETCVQDDSVWLQNHSPIPSRGEDSHHHSQKQAVALCFYWEKRWFGWKFTKISPPLKKAEFWPFAPAPAGTYTGMATVAFPTSGSTLVVLKQLRICNQLKEQRNWKDMSPNCSMIYPSSL